MKKKIKEQADKNDEGKIMVQLIPPQFIEDIGKVLTHGANKYAPNNWRKGLPWMKTYGAVLRHIFLWAKGEDIDKESGLPHLAHAATNICFLLEWSRTHKDMDDRIKE
jgi:hypothetical protein